MMLYKTSAYIAKVNLMQYIGCVVHHKHKGVYIYIIYNLEAKPWCPFLGDEHLHLFKFT